MEITSMSNFRGMPFHPCEIGETKVWPGTEHRPPRMTVIFNVKCWVPSTGRHELTEVCLRMSPEEAVKFSQHLTLTAGELGYAQDS